MFVLLTGALLALGLIRRWPVLRLAAAMGALGLVGAMVLAIAPVPAERLGLGWQGLVSLAVIGLLVFGYSALLGMARQRARVREAAPVREPDPGTLSDVELDRYARHIVLRELGGPGQQALRRARVLVVGAGGLGAPVCLYLAAAGVGRITVADDDRVSLSNLQRQVLFRDADLHAPKAAVAARAMLALNPHIDVRALDRRVGADDAALIAEHDLVIDGSDSFAARATVNRAAVAAGKPLIAGAIAQWEGQVTIYDPARGAPCMACIFPAAPAAGLAPSCAEAGVVGALPGVVGSMMALEAIKLIGGAGLPLRGRMLIYDGLWGETRAVTLRRDPACPVCGGIAARTS